MATVLLVRHGRTDANARGVLAGRAGGVGLDEVGRQQALRTAERLGAVRLVRVVSSPLMRCRQTARLVIEAQGERPEAPVERGLTEADYGDWQGRPISELAREPLWQVVQSRPSQAVFPGGESMLAMQARALAAVRRHDAAVEAAFGPGAVWAAVTHADLIKSVLIDAQGRPFDEFQQVAAAPASVSVIRHHAGGARVLASNSDGAGLARLLSEAER
ncbi:histidine phosphatase family protein [Gryllotalpicola daejeonensis]|uniref:Histidine phosphatase family protein n=1 Tax=Gryllotalpicola daejeonensis TaxID=993087 RepID=A0ABP7ZD10_9MICO